MRNQLHKINQLGTLVGRHLLNHLDKFLLIISGVLRHLIQHLDRFFLIISGILIFAAGYIADFLMSLTAINSWVIGINLYRFTFLLLIFALRREFIYWLGTAGFRGVYYLLINHFTDCALGYTEWSINDTLTITLILFEALLGYYGRKRVIFYLLYVTDTTMILLKNIFL